MFLFFCARKHDGRPKIIIDLKEIVHVVVQNDFLGLHLGGRYRDHLHYFRDFFQRLKRANVELIFFAFGKNLRSELSLFIPNQGQEYKRYLNVLDRFDANNGDVRFFCDRKAHDARAPITMYYNMHRLAREFGELRINYVLHNQEIAKYIEEHDGTVLAVITNDNDFMVFDGDFQFWQANNLNMRELTGVRKCRKKLRDRLQLNSRQLQLLSALSGSLYLPKTRLAGFYSKIRGTAMKNHYIADLAKYIREKVEPRITDDEKYGGFDLDVVARAVFGGDYYPHDLNTIKKGLAQYDLNFGTNDPTEDITKTMEAAKAQNMFIYKLLTDKVYLIVDIKFIDYRYYRSKNYAELIVPLLQKLYGILHANESQRPQAQEICMKYSHDESYKVQSRGIVYPQGKIAVQKNKNQESTLHLFRITVEIPDLHDLIFQKGNRQHNTIRWTLLQWLFGFEDDFMRSLKRIDTKYFAILVTIKYLLQVKTRQQIYVL